MPKYDVKFAGTIESTFLRDLLSWIVPIGLFFGIWYFMYRRFASQQGFGGLMAVGRSKAKVYVETDTKTTFADVAGVDEAKAELQEIVAFLKDPERYGRLGGRVPKGVLLVGPPGTGQDAAGARRRRRGRGAVLLDQRLGIRRDVCRGRRRAGARPVRAGARERAVHHLYRRTRRARPRPRRLPGGGGHDEKEQTLNQLLSELDGFDPRSGMVLLAATNRPEVLDPALLRAGRFDRQVLVDRPGQERPGADPAGACRRSASAPDVDLETVAALTPGFTGADLANLVNEAALLATRRGAEAVTMADFTAAMERIVAGLEKRNRLLNPQEREVVAYHEMGHTLVALSLPGTDKVHKVSIIPRGVGALGYTIQRPTEDRFLMTREELENKMAVLLGGRAAEHIVFGELSTGAADDLVKVTDIARSIVTRYGMSEELGLVAYEKVQRSFLGDMPQMPYAAERSYSEATAREIDATVRNIVDAAFRRTVNLLRAQREMLERGARLLLERETLDEADLAALRREPAVAE